MEGGTLVSREEEKGAWRRRWECLETEGKVEEQR